MKSVLGVISFLLFVALISAQRGCGHPCLNRGGKCQSSYSCTCNLGYAGARCDQKA
eukprot:gene1497-12114_t